MKPRLSIVIPAFATDECLENGLVSVLEHRPADSEVLVVLNRSYDDPYQLHDEIRFVSAPPRAGLVECLNLGCESSRGEFIHLLGCGFEVCEGWADAACEHFDDPSVGAVIPTLLTPGDSGRVAAVGVEYHPAGKVALHCPVLNGPGLNGLGLNGLGLNGSPSTSGSLPAPVGPMSLAAFYRAAAIQEVPKAFCAALGPLGADVDLALRLWQAGFTAIVEPSSRIVGNPEDLARLPAGFRQARRAERLFWRHCTKAGRARSLLGHLGLVAAETVRALPRPHCLTQLAGRVVGGLEHLARRSDRKTTSLAPASHDEPNQRLDSTRPELRLSHPRSATEAAPARRWRRVDVHN